jgi:hypothetical protein
MKKFTWFLALFFLAFRTYSADTDYKQVLVITNVDSIRVRLPLTGVTGKVRVKEQTADGLGVPVAPTKVSLSERHYIEWQIGYDVPDTNSPSIVPQINFQRNGETKYGHELARIIFEGVRLCLITTNDLIREVEALKNIQPSGFEENQPVQVETSTNAAASGFQSAFERLPWFTRTTPSGSVQIQLKQKQRAVGHQAMLYVCLPMNRVLDTNGNLRKPGPAKSRETVYYVFNSDNAAFILDIIHGFGIASQQHNEGIQKILGKILETVGGGTLADRR